MPDIDSRCVTCAYCAGVIRGTIYSIKSENVNDPEEIPKVTDYELCSIIIEALKKKGIN